MDNNELALALRESHLEKIAIYLSRCGLQTNAELIEKGYPDIGWDPVEGERFLDFLRFCVWVNGELRKQSGCWHRNVSVGLLMLHYMLLEKFQGCGHSGIEMVPSNVCLSYEATELDLVVSLGDLSFSVSE